MEEITMRPFKESDREALKNFKLSAAQSEFTSMPIEVLDAAIDDKNKFPVVVVNESNEIVGFFQLHKHYQHVGYDTPHNVIYIRSLSVNEAHQGRGYGTMIAMKLPTYVQENFDDLEHFYLVVDGDNEAAWSLYERAGFNNVAIKEDGPIGEERLYYLDLNQKYVHNIKIIHDKDYDGFKANIVVDQKKTVGYISGEIINTEFHLHHVIVEKTEQGNGYATSAMRQLPALLRRTDSNIEVIIVDEFKEKVDTALLKRVGYTKFKEDSLKYKKYIK